MIYWCVALKYGNKTQAVTKAELFFEEINYRSIFINARDVDNLSSLFTQLVDSHSGPDQPSVWPSAEK